MGIRHLFIALCAIPNAILADSFALTCEGSTPDWSLDLTETEARFAFLDRESVMDIPQRSTAEGADWPKAMTLIGPRDSAIIVLHQRSCQQAEFEIQVLTQRGETPILLTGCCRN